MVLDWKTRIDVLQLHAGGTPVNSLCIARRKPLGVILSMVEIPGEVAADSAVRFCSTRGKARTEILARPMCSSKQKMVKQALAKVLKLGRAGARLIVGKDQPDVSKNTKKELGETVD